MEHYNLRLDQDVLNYLRENCYLDELSTLIDQQPSTELEQAIVHAIYWLAEASRDKSALLKFIKLWTCAESFFAIEKG